MCVVLTPAEWTIHLGAPVVPDEYMMNRGCLNGSCSNSSWGNWSNSPHPHAKKSSINTLTWFKEEKKREKSGQVTTSTSTSHLYINLSRPLSFSGFICSFLPVGDCGEVSFLFGARVGNHHDFLKVRKTYREREKSVNFHWYLCQWETGLHPKQVTRSSQDRQSWFATRKESETTDSY